MKKTPLYENHLKLGGKIIDFGGWMLPVQYEGILPEHKAVREAAGLFDVSHMGEITVKGPQALEFLNRLLVNDISAAGDGKMIYSPMCYPDGGTVDDVMVYALAAKDYLVVVNAANTDKDYEWMLENNEEGADIKNVSDSYGQIALQGQASEKILQKLTNAPLSEMRFMTFAQIMIADIPALVSRSGYTGEDGFEIYMASEDAPKLWESILEAGREEGLKPAGLGARDTLRLEAALPLYGHELSREISPLEAGLGKFIKFGKEGFIGKEALAAQQQAGVNKSLIGFEMVDRAVPRNGFEAQSQGVSAGFVTSGSYSPSLDKNIGMALVSSELSAFGTELDIMIRNKTVKAKITALPFYSKKYKAK